MLFNTVLAPVDKAHERVVGGLWEPVSERIKVSRVAGERKR